MAGGVVSVTDVSDDEWGEARRRVISLEEARRLEIHAGREAHCHVEDVAGARPVVALSVLKRLLLANGFSVKLVWGTPDARHASRHPEPLLPELERRQMLGAEDLRALGFDGPDSEPPPDRWMSSPCHATLVNADKVGERDVRERDVEDHVDGEEDDDEHAVDEAMLAELYVEWEGVRECASLQVPLDEGLERFGAQTIVMYLLGGRYGELLSPIDHGLAMAAAHVGRIREALASAIPGKRSPPALTCHREAFEQALADDLDTPTAFLCLFDWIRETRGMRSGVGDRDLRAMLWMIGLLPSSRTGGEDAARRRA